MQKILLNLIGLFFFSSLFAQQTLQFSINGNRVTQTPDKDSDFLYTFPINMLFSQGFKNLTITVFADKNATKIIGKANFGTNISTDNTTGKFIIPITEDGIVLGDDPLAINDGHFYYNISRANGQVVLPLKAFKLKSGNRGIDNTINTAADYVPGYIYYDAIELRNLMNKTDPVSKKEIKNILAFYGINATSDMNAFLRDELGSFDFAGIQSKVGFISSAISSFGNLNVTNFADGLAKFMIERSKEELNIAFFRKFQEFLDTYPELQVIFPTTASFTKTIKTYNYAAMLPALRSAFQKDLNAFSSNLIALRELDESNCLVTDDKCKSRLKAIHTFLNDDPFGRSVVAGLLVADNLLQGNNAAETIDNLANDPVCQHFEENFSNLVQFANSISFSIHSKDEKRMWLTKSEANKLLNNESALKIYLGLLYQDEKKKPRQIAFNFSGGKTITLLQTLDLLHTKWVTTAKDFESLFRQVITAANSVSDAAENIVKAKEQGDQASILIYADYASSIGEFLKKTLGLLGNFINLDPELVHLQQDLAKFRKVIDPAVDACYDIKSQNYSALVLHTSSMLEEIIGANYEYKEKFVRYGTFMASVVEAKNSDDVKNAIDAAVLPAGSSSIKRETSFNISINSFIGPFGGAEYLPKLKEDKWSFVTGVTAPVGVAFSWGGYGRGLSTKGIEKGGKSKSLFVSLIDVGAIAAFRTKNDSSEVASEVKLENIIAPGVFFYYGFGKCPLSLGFGGQVGPQLRQVTATDINLGKNYYLRFAINVVVDIPFFNLYTKQD